MSQPFQASLYRDYDTGRFRWAVFCTASRTWIFSSRYGQAAAKALANRLNRENGSDAS